MSYLIEEVQRGPGRRGPSPWSFRMWTSQGHLQAPGDNTLHTKDWDDSVVAATLETKRQWGNAYKIIKESTLWPKTFYPMSPSSVRVNKDTKS